MDSQVRRPTEEELNDLAKSFGLNFSVEESKIMHSQVTSLMSSYDIVAKEPDCYDGVDVKYPRTSGRNPSKSENHYNAWARKTHIRGASEGDLVAKTVVIKDNVCIAGVPMTHGSSIIDGFIPEFDAPIITKMLDAGATIVGKSHCENLCISGGSHTNFRGPQLNPYDVTRTSGGSSSGTAILLSTKEVDFGIGGDQGGSIRIPSAFCGVCGMKATHGLIDYTGIFGLEPTVDHVGPMTRTVSENITLFQVLADKKISINPTLKNFRIGLLKEGFQHPNLSEASVDQAVREAGEVFRQLGAIVEEVSVPDHLMGPNLYTTIKNEGAYCQMFDRNGSVAGKKGFQSTSCIKAMARWKQYPDRLTTYSRITLLSGSWTQKHTGGVLYGKGQNLSRRLISSYDEKLKEYDILLLPTIPFCAPKLPLADSTEVERMKQLTGIIVNTCPFNVSGHPAMSIPCGTCEGLPIGMMMVSSYYNEEKIYKAGLAFESHCDWKERHF